jgi:hypothetical protein
MRHKRAWQNKRKRKDGHVQVHEKKIEHIKLEEKENLAMSQYTSRESVVNKGAT